MCVVVICDKRKPFYDEIENMWESNPHGGGVINWDGKKVSYVKGIRSLPIMVDEINKTKLPMVLHFRIASSGAVGQYLTHPFVVTSRNINPLRYSGKMPVLAHNGCCANAEEHFMIAHIAAGRKLPSGEWNDTRCAAWMVARSGLRVLENLNGSWAYVTPKGVTTIGEFREHEGLKCSNLYWLCSVQNYGYGSTYMSNGKWSSRQWDSRTQKSAHYAGKNDDDKETGLKPLSHYGKHFTEEMDFELTREKSASEKCLIDDEEI